MSGKTQLQEAVEKAAQDFAAQILKAIRNATLDEIANLNTDIAAPAKRRGRPPKKAEAPVEAAAVAKKPRKKRSWPTCTADGCEKNVYMPSGAKKMCYAHHMEAGGKPSPLVKARKKAGTAKPKASKAPKAPKAPKAKVVAAAPAEAPQAVAKKPRKKRSWPTCTVAGCTKNVYMPSGANKMCYAHHLEVGGKESPLAATNKKRKAAAAKKVTKKAKAKAPAKPKAKAAAKPKAVAKAKPKKKAVVRKAGQASMKAKKK